MQNMQYAATFISTSSVTINTENSVNSFKSLRYGLYYNKLLSKSTLIMRFPIPQVIFLLGFHPSQQEQKHQQYHICEQAIKNKKQTCMNEAWWTRILFPSYWFTWKSVCWHIHTYTVFASLQEGFSTFLFLKLPRVCYNCEQIECPASNNQRL